MGTATRARGGPQPVRAPGVPGGAHGFGGTAHVPAFPHRPYSAAPNRARHGFGPFQLQQLVLIEMALVRAGGRRRGGRADAGAGRCGRRRTGAASPCCAATSAPSATGWRPSRAARAQADAALPLHGAARPEPWPRCGVRARAAYVRVPRPRPAHGRDGRRRHASLPPWCGWRPDVSALRPAFGARAAAAGAAA